ncbi:MAG: glycoside hydrolase [Chloroflexota bacterium]|nr:glycoside hydrolase [Chloroflexota bacterium]
MTRAADLDALVGGAKAVLRENDLGRWTKPAPALYPHQWNWDSCFIAIGLSHYQTERAAQELLSLLRGQWQNGMVPQIVFNPNAGGYFPGPDVWRSERSPRAPVGIETSGITQPPVLAIAALAIWQNAGDRAQARSFLQEVYPKILAFHRFLYEERDPDGTGLIVVLHPWESGLDNSPPYLDAGSRVHMAQRPTYQRLDTKHIAAQNRPTDKDYDLYIYLLEQMRDLNWDQRSYLEHAPLQVQDVLFNSILCNANSALAEIAGIVGEDPSQANAWRESTIRAINERLWDEQAGTYFSYDRVARQLLKDDTIAGFGVLYGSAAPADRADRLLRIRLTNPREYWPDPGYPIPTTAMDSPWFDPGRYWLGPVWVNTNWLLIHGLMKYDRVNLAADLTHRTIDLVDRSGFREYYHPITGHGYGTEAFSWSAALTVDLIAGMGFDVRS